MCINGYALMDQEEIRKYDLEKNDQLEVQIVSQEDLAVQWENRVQVLQYKSLRKNFRENLINPILGENYYNMGMDTYTCDEETTLDLKYRFDEMQTERDIARVVAVGMTIISVILLIALFTLV